MKKLHVCITGLILSMFSLASLNSCSKHEAESEVSLNLEHPCDSLVVHLQSGHLLDVLTEGDWIAAPHSISINREGRVSFFEVNQFPPKTVESYAYIRPSKDGIWLENFDRDGTKKKAIAIECIYSHDNHQMDLLFYSAEAELITVFGTIAKEKLNLSNRCRRYDVLFMKISGCKTNL